jgi:hypothetical protein
MVFSRIENRYDGPPRHEIVSGQLLERASVRVLG